MSKLQAALDLAALGYHVFPLEVNSKIPHIDGFPTQASRDPAQIKAWWTDPVMGFEQGFNIGISTTNFGESSSLLVVDVDKKGDKDGDVALLALELAGFTLPDTAVASTPTGGRHHIYRVERALRQSAGELGDGLDTRSRGGYIVAAGSTLAGGVYAWNTSQYTPSDAPDWLQARFGVGAVAVHSAVGRGADTPISVSTRQALNQAVHYLTDAKPVPAGERNHAGFKTAAMLKDYGVAEADCADIMLGHWKCEPMLDLPELEHVIKSAYTYGTAVPGSLAADRQFESIVTKDQQPSTSTDVTEHPFQILNKQFAFVLAGGGSHILWETTDAAARAQLQHLNLTSFHQKFASWDMTIGRKSQPVTELWMKDKTRRSYDGLCFRPGLETPPRFYNLWQGFAVEPLSRNESATSEAKQSLDMLLEHITDNVCNGSAELWNWLIGFFAHMIQRPWEKPLVALVFRGGKGVGKSAVVERIGHLLGNHFLSTSNRRFLVHNFNGHLENNLFFVLEEAFWSGDKQAEGILKDLITGSSHVIEHKGKETFTVDNRSRVGIIGNENWLVPASHDERRYAVFDVGDSRKQDRNFFTQMRVGMEHGGYRALLSYLSQFPLGGLDFNAAPATQGLLDQKEESLDPIHAWWRECLAEGRIIGSDFEETWPAEVDTDRFRQAYQRYAKERNIRSWGPDTSRIGRVLKKCVPEWSGRQRARANAALHSVYRIPPLEDCRDMWSKFIGHVVEWGY